uniref:Retrovirus-related Pol polyprotein from transposon TNT 1-94 n=1 Tax=Tanacetum cinerariifolium TaxID=118510 RepID=A0A6L2P3V1_TANCI|nr:retrovirus-related Pol polyprotein from transposon TNT 1-94 [Tanacetum cinerariifolium]
MSRDVITVGSTMRIPLLYRGEYSQWRERFMNYLEEQTYGEAMINSIHNGDQPLAIIAQVSLAGMHRTNETAKELWDALERQMHGSEYGEQDRKAAILYEFETFKANEGDQFLDTYLRYLQVINNLKKCGYKKDNCKLNYKFLNNLHNGNSMQNQGDVNYALGYKKKAIVVTSDLLALVAEKMKVNKRKEKVVVSSNSDGSGANDFSELKKITTLLAKAFNRIKFYSKPTNNNLRTSSTSQSTNKKQEFVKSNDKKEDKKADEKKSDRSKEINANMVFMAQIKKVLLESDESSSSAEETIDEVIGLGYTPMFLTHSDEALEIEKFKRSRENKIKFAYDYGNLNASYVNEKINFTNDYFQEITNPDFDKIDSPIQQTSSLKPYVSNVILEKIIIDLEDEVVSLLEKEKANLKTIESLKSKDLDTSSSVRIPKHSGVIWKRKGSSNTSNVDLSYVSHLKLNKDVKRYSRKDLLSCNNSHLGETSGAYVCNDAMNVSDNSSMGDLLDDNNFFIFDDESVRISPISKMPFRKKPCDSMIVRSKSKLNKSLPRTVHKWLPKLQPLAEPVAKWFPRIIQICLWIIDSGCSKHMTGNRALLTNFVKKFLGTVRFGNNDFAVIAGYGDVVIVVVDDYSWYTRVFFLHSKDEASELLIDQLNHKTRSLSVNSHPLLFWHLLVVIQTKVEYSVMNLIANRLECAI